MDYEERIKLVEDDLEMLMEDLTSETDHDEKKILKGYISDLKNEKAELEQKIEFTKFPKVAYTGEWKGTERLILKVTNRLKRMVAGLDTGDFIGLDDEGNMGSGDKGYRTPDCDGMYQNIKSIFRENE